MVWRIGTRSLASVASIARRVAAVAARLGRVRASGSGGGVGGVGTKVGGGRSLRSVSRQAARSAANSGHHSCPMLKRSSALAIERP